MKLILENLRESGVDVIYAKEVGSVELNGGQKKVRSAIRCA